MFHEVKNQDVFLREIESLLKPNGQVLIVEPPLHVSKTVFKEMIGKAQKAGLVVAENPKVFLSKAVVLKKGEQGA